MGLSSCMEQAQAMENTRLVKMYSMDVGGLFSTRSMGWKFHFMFYYDEYFREQFQYFHLESELI